MSDKELCDERHDNIKDKFNSLICSWKEDFQGHKDWVKLELIKTDKKIEDAIVLVKETNAAIRSLTDSIATFETFMIGFKDRKRDIITKILYPLIQAIVFYMLVKYIK